MDTKIEDSNLAYIGTEEDKAARKAAASLEVDWTGCGQSVGVEIWRVENKRTDDGTPDFGIEKWPISRYGEFYQGDSYIVLQTTKDDRGGFLYDIFFWIGSKSSQDEYGVAAYKATELDDLLGSLPVQHRELEGFESSAFTECFSSIPGGLRYLDGGIDSGFRDVTADEGAVSQLPTQMYHVVKSPKDKTPRSTLVPVSCQSLNTGDAFVVDAGSIVYTWYGPECSAFEKHKAVQMASSMVDSRNGQAVLKVDVGEENDAFWELLGGKTNITSSSTVTSGDISHASPVLYVLQDEDSRLKIVQVECSPQNLDTSAVCMIDLGSECILWIGNAATKREQSQAMIMMGTYLKSVGRHHNTSVSRVCEGQEDRCSSWSQVF